MHAFSSRRWGWGLLLVSAAVLALLVCGAGRTPTLSDYSVSEEEWRALQSTRRETRDPLLTQLTFNGYDLLPDTAEDRYYYSLLEDDPHAYDPPVTWRAAHAGVRLAVRETAITPEGIAAGQPLHVMAYDDTRYSLHEVACTTLPLLALDTDYTGPAIDAADWTGDPAVFTLFDNRAGAARRLLRTPAVYHTRGGSTAALPQHGYRVTLLEESLGGHMREYDVSVLGMRQDGDWILYAGYPDHEKVRNVFCSDLWMDSCARNNPYGIVNGMEYRYVELLLDGRYWGLYAIGFPLDAKQLALQKDRTGNYTEYQFKTDAWSTWEPDTYELRTPGANDASAWAAFTQYYDTLCNSTDAAQLYALADIGNAIDIYLFYNLIQGSDHVYGPITNAHKPTSLYNTFLTVKRGGMLYTPWDLDHTFGASVQDSTGMYGVPPDANYVMGLNPVTRLQALGDAQIDALVRQRYAELRQGAWSEESLVARLDEMERQIFDSGAFARDVARWPESNHVAPEDKLSRFKAFVLARLGYLDAFVEALP